MLIETPRYTTFCLKFVKSLAKCYCVKTERLPSKPKFCSDSACLYSLPFCLTETVQKAVYYLKQKSPCMCSEENTDICVLLRLFQWYFGLFESFENWLPTSHVKTVSFKVLKGADVCWYDWIAFSLKINYLIYKLLLVKQYHGKKYFAHKTW